MNFDISLSDGRKYIHIRINEPVTVNVLNDFICETAKIAGENEINNFLFDLRCAPNRAGLFDHYEFVYKRSKGLGFKQGSKHALVVNPEQVDDYSFIETILVNAGYRGKMFTDELIAIEWLEK